MWFFNAEISIFNELVDLFPMELFEVQIICLFVAVHDDSTSKGSLRHIFDQGLGVIEHEWCLDFIISIGKMESSLYVRFAFINCSFETNVCVVTLLLLFTSLEYSLKNKVEDEGNNKHNQN